MRFRAQHIFTFWLGLELNLLAFIGILKLCARKNLDTSYVKYFLPQALGSALFFVFVLIKSLSWVLLARTFLVLSLLIKLGLFPFQFWFIRVGGCINFESLFLLSVPQKLLPFWGLISNEPVDLILYTRLAGGVFLRLEGALRTYRLNLILVYSSLINSSWFLLALTRYDLFFWIFLVYRFSVALILHTAKAHSGGTLVRIKMAQINWITRRLLLILLLNLGGMPPFINIWGKIALLQALFRQTNLLVGLAFIARSLVFFYVYLRVGFSFFTISQRKPHLAEVVLDPTVITVLVLGSGIFFVL